MKKFILLHSVNGDLCICPDNIDSIHSVSEENYSSIIYMMNEGESYTVKETVKEIFQKIMYQEYGG